LTSSTGSSSSGTGGNASAGEPSTTQLFQDILVISQQFITNQHKCNVFYFYVQLFNSILQFAFTDCVKKLKQIETLQQSTDEHKPGYQSLFQELYELGVFYHRYLASYFQMLHEIDRRHKQLKTMQDLIDSFNKQLKEAQDGEAEKRTMFDQLYGIYLPSSLCPSLKEVSPVYRVTPPSVSTTLPQMSISQLTNDTTT